MATMVGEGEHVDVFPLAMILSDEMFRDIIPLPGNIPM